MMRIALVATHAHPLPSPAHTGDSQVILDLARSLAELGYHVTLFAPKGSVAPEGVTLKDCELCHVPMHFRNHDIVHDWTIGALVGRQAGLTKVPFVHTLLGGTGYSPLPNTVVWSQAMRDRVMRGATDYENTPTPDAGGPPCQPFKDVRVIYGGVDTEFYSPGEQPDCLKREYDEQRGYRYLWLSRWHPMRGYKRAIEWASLTGNALTMCGAHPDYDHPYQAECAHEAMRLAEGKDNIRFEFLPNDPDHHTAKRDQYRRHKNFLLTVEFQEPFGLSTVEAMACGCRLKLIGQTPRMGSTEEIVGDYLEKLERPRERAIRLFDRMVMARNYVKAYEDVLAGRGWG